MVVDDDDESSPRVTWPTICVVLPMGREPLKAMDTVTGRGSPAGCCACAAAPRRFVIRRFTPPAADRLKLRPLNATWDIDDAVANTGGGASIEPLSTDSATSVRPFSSVRLVMFTDWNNVRLPVTVWPPVPPEQVSRMSPMRSVSPSALTKVGTALPMQVSAAFPAETKTQSPANR